MWPRKFVILSTVSITLFLFCHFVWANSESQSLSPKIGPLLKKAIQTSARKTELIKVIVVMNRDHLKPLPENLINELKDRVEKLGGHIGDHAFNNIQVWIPINKIEELARWPEIKLIKAPTRPRLNSITSEGKDVIGATSWHNNGLTGKGVKIGVIDSGFQGYSSLLGTELPASVNVRVFGAQTNINSSNHGTACAEIIHDIVPEAELYLAVISDLEVDFYNAAVWLQSQGVKVISCSITQNFFKVCALMYWMLQYPLTAEYVADVYLVPMLNEQEQMNYTINSLTAQGVSWCQAAGNHARQKWKGWFSDPDWDYWLNFTSYQNYNKIEIPKGLPHGYEFYVAMAWDLENVGYAYDDYDLYITDGFGNIVAGSEIRQVFNGIPMEACRFVPIPGVDYYVWVWRQWATSKEILIMLGVEQFLNFQIYTPQTSLVSPADNPNAITVGAVPYYNPNQIEDFSSQGPTPEGVIKPDLVAPDGVSTSSYGWNKFYGTSAAAPHVAGACALVKQVYSEWSPGQIKNFLESRAIDLGALGKDNVYGSGLLSLGTPPLLDIIIPDIKINSSDGPVTLTQSDILTITIVLDNNGITDNADWWLAADTPFGLWFYTFDGWTTNWVPAYQGQLFYLDSYEVFSTSVSGLPEGTYTLYFGVDTVMDSNVTWDSLYYDTVVVNITE